MNQTLELCRWVYNETLATRKNAWEQEQKSISNYDTHNMLPSWKTQHPELKTVHSQVLQEAQQRVDIAFKAFFRRVKSGDQGKAGYPRFKGKGWYDSFTYPQSGFALKDLDLRISKIGNVKIKLHRVIGIEGTIKRLTINRRATGKWFACFTVDLGHKEPQQRSYENNAVIGIDVGLSSFATLSNGEHIENPRFFKTEQKALAKAQRNETKQVVTRIHERIANKRNNFAHQLSRKLANTYHTIAFEQLNVKGMMQNGYPRLAKSIGDVAWSQFITFTKNKAENAGSTMVMVDPKNTTQECSRCGNIVKKGLRDRIHECSCGLVLDRDENAAINILRRGLASVRKTDRSPLRERGE